MSKHKFSKKVLIVYEPKLVPEFDSDGNVKCYKHPIAIPDTLDKIDSLREKKACAELGLSADPTNVTGFRRLCDIINQNRNLPNGVSISNVGYDDLSVMSNTTAAISKVKSANSSKK